MKLQYQLSGTKSGTEQGDTLTSNQESNETRDKRHHAEITQTP